MSEATGWGDRMAALFAVVNADAAKAAVQAQALDAEAAQARESLTNAQAALGPQTLEAEQTGQAVQVRKAAGIPSWARVGGPAAIGVFLLVAVVFAVTGDNIVAQNLAMTIAVLALFGAGVVGSLVVAVHARFRKEVAALTQAATRAHSAREVTADVMRHRLQQIQSLQERRSQLEIKSAVTTLGQVLLPIRSVQVAGYAALFDESGSIPLTHLSLPELPASEDVLRAVEGAVSAAAARPALLTPTPQTRGAAEPGVLHGQERDLANAMEAFGEMVDSAAVYESDVRLVPRNDPFARLALSAGVTTPRQGTILRGGDDARPTIAKLSSALGRSRSTSGGARERLTRAAASMKDAAQSMGVLREQAVQHVHAAVAEVVQRSHYAHSAFYCPRCNHVPAYLFHCIGIEEEQVHTLAPGELYALLERNPDCQARMEREPALLDELAQLIGKVRELQAIVDLAQGTLEAGRSNPTPNFTELRMQEAVFRAQCSERDKHVLQLRGCIRRIVTGDLRPLTELSRLAQLHLDPDTKDWTCGSCAKTFSDSYIIRMGQVLRIKDELMFPMWNHLWTEKEDFCRSELFRTNEQMSNLVERESGAMRDIAEQYRADMRPVRENLILAVTEVESGQDRIADTVESLVAVGVLSQADADERIARVTDQTGSDLGQMRKRVEAKETILVQLPAGQIVNRPSAIDPITRLKDPAEVFRRPATTSQTLSLSSSTEEDLHG